MKRFLVGFLGLVVALGALVVAPEPASAQAPRYFLQAVTENTGVGLGAVGRCRVLTTGTKTDATVYSDYALATSKTNPIALDSQGECSWYGATGTTYDVLLVIDSGTYKGSLIHVKDFTATSQKKVQVARSAGTRVLMIPYSGTANAATNTATQTVDAGAHVRDVLVESVTGGTGAAKMHIGHANIGVAGYCSAVTVQSNGLFYYCSPTAPTDANKQLHGTTAFAVQYTTQGHTASGYIWLYYHPSAF